MADQTGPLANIFTLGAVDVAKLRAFYAQLGWPVIVDDGEFVAFELRGAILALFPLDKLAADGRTRPEPGQGGLRFSIGALVESADAVDALIERVRQAGGTVTKEPVSAEFFDGRSAYFADPEGNFWEVAWGPADNVVIVAARRAAGLQPGL